MERHVFLPGLGSGFARVMLFTVMLNTILPNGILLNAIRLNVATPAMRKKITKF
jgi:hypothetical protein